MVVLREEPATRLVRIVYRDGSEVECETTPALAASIARMDTAEQRRERKHRKHVKTATDLGVRAESWWQTRRLVPRRGPVPGVIYFGEGAVWSGPAALWLRWHEETEDRPAGWYPCQPGEEPHFDANGHRTGKDLGQRCRFCSHAKTITTRFTCLNADCIRERRRKGIYS